MKPLYLPAVRAQQLRDFTLIRQIERLGYLQNRYEISHGPGVYTLFLALKMQAAEYFHTLICSAPSQVENSAVSVVLFHLWTEMCFFIILLQLKTFKSFITAERTAIKGSALKVGYQVTIKEHIEQHKVAK